MEEIQPQDVIRLRFNTEDDVAARQAFIAGMQANGYDVSDIATTDDMNIGENEPVHWVGRAQVIDENGNPVLDQDGNTTFHAGRHVNIKTDTLDLTLFDNCDRVYPLRPANVFS